MVDQSKDSYAERLKLAMGTMKPRQLSDALKVSYQAVKKVLDGGSNAFAVPNHYAAADWLKVNPRWLGLGTGTMKQGEEMAGWPLSPELLAVLQNADERTVLRAENAARIALDMPPLVAQLTGNRAA